jgi:hypothetical protein
MVTTLLNPPRFSEFLSHPPRNVFLLPRDFFCFPFPFPLLLLLLPLERDKLNRTRLVGFLLDDLLRDDAIVIL